MKENLEKSGKHFMETQAFIRRFAEQQADCMAQLNQWASSLKKVEESSACSRVCDEDIEQKEKQQRAIGEVQYCYRYATQDKSMRDSNEKYNQDCSSKDTENEIVPVDSARLNEDSDAVLLEYQKQGNDFYNQGKFQQAVNCYTKCLVLNPRSDLAYSNRAMSYLKLKEWKNAEDDADSSLQINPWNVKSLQRRSTARVSLGKLRAALQDSYLAEIAYRHNNTSEVSTVPKEISTAQKNIQNLLRDAVQRAPARSLTMSARTNLLSCTR